MTTGATALSGLDALSASANVWRCFLNYLGGLGIMLLVVAVLPMMGLGGFQVYKAETPGPIKDAKFTPRIADTARGLWAVGCVFCVFCGVFAGLPFGGHELGGRFHAHVFDHGAGRVFVL